jgi:hypothetical protein
MWSCCAGVRCPAASSVTGWPLACSRLAVWFMLEGPDSAALAAPAAPRAAEASAPAAMVEIARFFRS